MRDTKLFLEERVWVVRKILNEDAVRLGKRLGLTEAQQAAFKNWVLNTMSVLEGQRSAVPRRHRHVLRPLRPAPRPKLPPNPDRA